MYRTNECSETAIGKNMQCCPEKKVVAEVKFGIGYVASVGVLLGICSSFILGLVWAIIYMTTPSHPRYSDQSNVIYTNCVSLSDRSFHENYITNTLVQMWCGSEHGDEKGVHYQVIIPEK